jgi:plastocyanin
MKTGVNMKKMLFSILAIVALSALLVACACTGGKTVTTTNTVTVSGTASITVNSNGFQPSTMMARVGTTITFNNNMGSAMSLMGKSGFSGPFGGMMMQMGGNYPFTFNTPGTYVVAVSGQNLQCTITIVQ